MTTRLAVIGGDGLADTVAAALETGGAEVVTMPSGADGAEASLADTDAVLSFALPSLARRVAVETAPLLGPDTMYVDLSRGTPGVKRATAEIFTSDTYVDAAVAVDDALGMLHFTASGPRAGRFTTLLGHDGHRAEAISTRVGDVAARRLLTALMDEELSAVVADTLWAAQSVQQQAWAYDELQRRFDALSAASVAEYVHDLSRNGKRRQIEMMDVTEMLGETGYTSTLGDGVALTYSRLLHSVKIPFGNAR